MKFILIELLMVVTPALPAEFQVQRMIQMIVESNQTQSYFFPPKKYFSQGLLCFTLKQTVMMSPNLFWLIN